jgi:hypothetical protein
MAQSGHVNRQAMSAFGGKADIDLILPNAANDPNRQ